MAVSSAEIKLYSRIGMAGTVGAVLTSIAENDEKLLVLTADMARAFGLERFQTKFPEKLINAGIAENNLIGVSGGLASEGYGPFAMAHAAFITARALDFVRMNLGYMHFPVKLVGFASGFALGASGATHAVCDDIAFMRALNGITILSPADTLECVKCVEAAAALETPCYIRLSRLDRIPIVYNEDYDFEINKSVTLLEGRDLTIFTHGAQVSRMLECAVLLSESGVSAKVVNMHTLRPLDTDAIDAALNAKLIVTAEEHSLGGLGTAIAEYLSTKPSHPEFLPICVPQQYFSANEYDELVREAGLTSEQCYNKITDKLK